MLILNIIQQLISFFMQIHILIYKFKCQIYSIHGNSQQANANSPE